MSNKYKYEDRPLGLRGLMPNNFTKRLVKKEMTLNLLESEMDILQKEADEQGISKTIFIRQALNFYQQHLHSELKKPVKAPFI